MRIRTLLKKALYGYCPGLAGAFPYFGTRVYFKRNSLIFDLVCEEGIYEQKLLALILEVTRPTGWYFDVGANIGLMSVPVLRSRADVTVVSFEPSPNSTDCLYKTWEQSPWRGRWHVIAKAVGDRTGNTSYNLSNSRFGGYDGVEHTRRVDSVRSVTVPLTTLDEEWSILGCPLVSCIKLDVEGSEIRALLGSRRLIAGMRPWIFLEWYSENFSCLGHEASDLLHLADELDYRLVALPHLIEVDSPSLLQVHCRTTASFLLVPERPRVVTRQSAIRQAHR